LNALADELQAATAAPQTADAPDRDHRRLCVIRRRAIERELEEERRRDVQERRARWLDDFAHGIYVMEMRWAYLLARQWKHHVGAAKGAV